MIPVNILQVSLDGEIRAELPDVYVFQRRLLELGCNGERRAIFPGDFRGIE
jgi:hypothetical protein